MADTASLFTTGDVVFQNPLPAGVLFGVVVIMSVGLENIFGAFREHQSRFIKLLFLQISEEIMIVGVIGMCFVFVTQSITTMPLQWLVLFRWIQTVLFFLMVFFICGIILSASLTLLFIRRFGAEEIAAQRLEDAENASPSPSGRATVMIPEGVELSSMQRGYFIARAIFTAHANALQEKARTDFRRRQQAARAVAGRRALKNDESMQEPPYIAAITSVTLVEYLQECAKDTVVKNTDISWQCWFSIAFLTTANSLRMFVLPTDLQTKNLSAFTVDDHQLDSLTYIFLIGWIPGIIFVVAVLKQLVNARGYLNNAARDMTNRVNPDRDGALDEGLLQMPSAGGRVAPRAKMGGTSVWLPPKDLTEILMGRASEDPSVYLLRGNRSFTLHMLKIPSLLSQLYLAMFIVGQWGALSLSTGARQSFILPLALLPPFAVALLMPMALATVTLLTSLGSRLNEGAIVLLARRIAVRNSGGTDEEVDAITDEADGVGLANELAAVEELSRATAFGSGSKDNSAVLDKLDRLEQTLQHAIVHGHAVDDDTEEPGFIELVGGSAAKRSAARASKERASEQIAQLNSRIRFLEGLCEAYGVPIGQPGSSSELLGGSDSSNPNSIAQVCASLSRLQDSVAKLAETQQSMLVAASARSRMQDGANSSGAALSASPGDAGTPTMLDYYTSGRRGALPATPQRLGMQLPSTAGPAPSANATRDIARFRGAPQL